MNMISKSILTLFNYINNCKSSNINSQHVYRVWTPSQLYRRLRIPSL